MKSFAVIAVAATAVMAQSPPAGCQASRSGTFNIQTVNVTSSGKRDLSRRQLAGALTLSLKDGIVKDQAGRQGYIASNYQFQFDAPLQAGARESTGFSVCGNGSLALSANGRAAPAVFYQCLSGDFYNLYSQSTGAQCIPIYINAVNSAGGSGASQISDGQPQVTQPPVVSQISDGQPQASKPAVISQISDGQPQAGTPKPSAGPVVSQIPDGQPQAPKPVGPIVSQISDGQPQAPTPKPVGPIVSQISDGQPQAPVATANATVSRPAPSQFTGAAATNNAVVGAFAAGLFGLMAML
ncbi:hypothetical protein HBI09_063140 [Parastagonospora nodorum]|nr:hypothetical protein HBI09_063140 [Parastagonospora nodorum]KAH4999517.1 hypothetical protein HBI77_171490 [Parastagonospora nodorum]